LNPEFFIANRILKGDKTVEAISRPIVKIAILGIALGIAIMILAVSIVTGFKTQIRDKVIGFGSHIQIHHYDTHNYFEPNPINKNQDFLPKLKQNPEINHIQMYAIKPGIIKTKEEIEGVLVKGVGPEFKWDFFRDKLTAGEIPVITDTAISSNVVISQGLATKLKLNAGDDLIMYFIQHPARMRKFSISGIYQTGLEEFDKLYVIADIQHVQRLNDWDENFISGFEIFINDYNKLDEVADFVSLETEFDLNAQTIRELHPQIFDWLDLQDVNVKIILILMILVAGINMIATLLVLILERTNTIGIFKSLGMQNFSIQKIFLYKAAYIIGNGILWGNFFGLLLCFVQLKFEVFKLDEANYYISSVPINLDVLSILAINIGTLVICILMLLIPSYIISRIDPVKAIRFS
jgi:lipoprotein-releasing system permease protein